MTFPPPFRWPSSCRKPAHLSRIRCFLVFDLFWSRSRLHFSWILAPIWEPKFEPKSTFSKKGLSKERISCAFCPGYCFSHVFRRFFVNFAWKINEKHFMRFLWASCGFFNLATFTIYRILQVQTHVALFSCFVFLIKKGGEIRTRISTCESNQKRILPEGILRPKNPLNSSAQNQKIVKNREK